MAAGPDNEETEEWQFTLEELDDDQLDGDSGQTEESGNIAGTLARDQPLEPGDIDLENAAFVLLGVLLVVGLIAAAIVGL